MSHLDNLIHLSSQLNDYIESYKKKNPQSEDDPLKNIFIRQCISDEKSSSIVSTDRKIEFKVETKGNIITRFFKRLFYGKSYNLEAVLQSVLASLPTQKDQENLSIEDKITLLKLETRLSTIVQHAFRNRSNGLELVQKLQKIIESDTQSLEKDIEPTLKSIEIVVQYNLPQTVSTTLEQQQALLKKIISNATDPTATEVIPYKEHIKTTNSVVAAASLFNTVKTNSASVENQTGSFPEIFKMTFVQIKDTIKEVEETFSADQAEKASTKLSTANEDLLNLSGTQTNYTAIRTFLTTIPQPSTTEKLSTWGICTGEIAQAAIKKLESSTSLADINTELTEWLKIQATFSNEPPVISLHVAAEKNFEEIASTVTRLENDAKENEKLKQYTEEKDLVKNKLAEIKNKIIDKSKTVTTTSSVGEFLNDIDSLQENIKEELQHIEEIRSGIVKLENDIQNSLRTEIEEKKTLFYEDLKSQLIMLSEFDPSSSLIEFFKKTQSDLEALYKSPETVNSSLSISDLKNIQDRIATLEKNLKNTIQNHIRKDIDSAQINIDTQLTTTENQEKLREWIINSEIALVNEQISLNALCDCLKNFKDIETNIRNQKESQKFHVPPPPVIPLPPTTGTTPSIKNEVLEPSGPQWLKDVELKRHTALLKQAFTNVAQNISDMQSAKLLSDTERRDIQNNFENEITNISNKIAQDPYEGFKKDHFLPYVKGIISCIAHEHQRSIEALLMNKVIELSKSMCKAKSLSDSNYEKWSNLPDNIRVKEADPSKEWLESCYAEICSIIESGLHRELTDMEISNLSYYISTTESDLLQIIHTFNECSQDQVYTTFISIVNEVCNSEETFYIEDILKKSLPTRSSMASMNSLERQNYIRKYLLEALRKEEAYPQELKNRLQSDIRNVFTLIKNSKTMVDDLSSTFFNYLNENIPSDNSEYIDHIRKILHECISDVLNGDNIIFKEAIRKQSENTKNAEWLQQELKTQKISETPIESFKNQLNALSKDEQQIKTFKKSLFTALDLATENPNETFNIINDLIAAVIEREESLKPGEGLISSLTGLLTYYTRSRAEQTDLGINEIFIEALQEHIGSSGPQHEQIQDGFKIYLYLARNNRINLPPAIKNATSRYNRLLEKLENAFEFKDIKLTTLRSYFDTNSFDFNNPQRTFQIIYSSTTNNGLRQSEKFLNSDSFELSQLSLEIGLQKLVNNSSISKESCPVYFGTEWRFYAENEKEFQQTLDKLAAISGKYPGVLFMPGSIAWSDPLDDNPGKRIAFNSMPVFFNGSLIHLYHKEHDSGDRETLVHFVNEGKKSKDDFLWGPTLTESNLYLKPVIEQYNSHVFTFHEYTMSLEICNDHVHGGAKMDYQSKYPQGTGVDVQFVTAHGTQPRNQNMTSSKDGAYVYIDISQDAKTLLAQVDYSPTLPRLNTLHSHISNDNSEIGGLRTQVESAHVTLPYSPLPDCLYPEKIGNGHTAFFEAIATQLKASKLELGAITGSDIMDNLAEFLSKHEKEYYPSKEACSPGNWSANKTASYLNSIRKRYTFNNKQVIDSFIKKLREGSLDEKTFNQFQSILPQLIADAFNIDIIVHQNLTSAPTKLYSPSGYLKNTRQAEAIHIAYSHEEKLFYTVNIRSGEEFKTAISQYKDKIDYFLKAVENTSSSSEEVEQARQAIISIIQQEKKQIKSAPKEKSAIYEEVIRYLNEVLSHEKAICIANLNRTFFDTIQSSGIFLGYYAYEDNDQLGMTYWYNESQLDSIYNVLRMSVKGLFYTHDGVKKTEETDPSAEKVASSLRVLKANYEQKNAPVEFIEKLQNLIATISE